MARHVPGVVWTLRALEYGAYVRTISPDTLTVQVVDPDTMRRTTFDITRNDARLLAKRLNQCLDETRS